MCLQYNIVVIVVIDCNIVVIVSIVNNELK